MESRALSSGLIALVAISWMGCTAPNPLADGLTEAHKTQIIEKTIAEIELSDSYTPDNFEQRQKRHFEQMTPEMHETALDHLPARVEENARVQGHREAIVNRESAQLEIERELDEEVRVSVAVVGSNRYRSQGNSSKTQEVRWTLPWKITVEDGALVMRHSGIRLKVF